MLIAGLADSSFQIALDPLKKKLGGMKIIVPLEDFALTKATEFAAQRNSASHSLVRGIFARFPFMPQMPPMHPSMEHSRTCGPPKPNSHYTPLDWQWHRLKLRHARIRDELNRITHRVEIEDLQRELHGIREDDRVARMRAFYFHRANKNQKKHTDIVMESALTNADRSHKLTEYMHALRDEHKQREFMAGYLRIFRPSVREMERFLYKHRMEPTLAQIRTAADIAVTPFEALLQVLDKKIPFIKREAIERALARFATQINQTHLRAIGSMEYRDKVSKLFVDVFFRHVENRFFENRTEKRHHFEHKDRDLRRQEDVFWTARHNREYGDHHLELMAHYRKDFEGIVAHKHSEKKLIDSYYAEKKQIKHELFVLDTYKPINVQGQMGHAQFNPRKFRTQISILKHYVDVLNQERFRADVQLGEQELRQQEHSSKMMKQVADHSLRHAVETERLREAAWSKQMTDRFEATQMYAAILNHVARERRVDDKYLEFRHHEKKVARDIARISELHQASKTGILHLKV